LLAFLLAFTFGIAADAYNARKLALVDEANAIRMTYLLSDVIPEAHRVEIRTVLRKYVDERLRWANTQPDEPGASAEELLNRLWKSAAIVGAQNPGGVDVFLSYVGRVIELQQARVMVRERSRIPGAYWVVLFMIALLALSAVGYHSGVAGTSRSPLMLAVAIAFSAVIMVIADLDRPGQGFINVSQEPIVDLRARLAESEP
jgi:fumarate reductase subunit C